MSEEIKPCPFCGSDEVEQFKKVNRIHDVKLLGYCCWNCGAHFNWEAVFYVADDCYFGLAIVGSVCHCNERYAVVGERFP